MFGKILNIYEDIVELENTSGEAETNLLGFHVVFPVSERKIIGEIIYVSNTTIKVNLIGEIINGKFSDGLIKKPSLKGSCRLIYKSEVEALLGPQDYSMNNALFIGKSLIYDNFNVSANINDFMSGHFAILGNTGSGKSCGTARIIQNIFYYNDTLMPTNAHIAVFDAYGEYNSAFSKLERLPNIHYRNYTAKIERISGDVIKIPAYFLDVDDIALLLNVTDSEQLQIIQKSIDFVRLFKNPDAEVENHKNKIIATAILDVLTSSKDTNQMRDQIIAVLSKFNTPSLNLDTPIVQPGYIRSFRQCLNTDAQGKMNAIQLVVELLEKFTHQDLKPIRNNTKVIYNLNDLYDAFEFALISEGVLQSDRVFDRNNILKVRLGTLINNKDAEYFDYPEDISKLQYVKNLFSTINGEPCQVINLNFGALDDRFAKTLTKILCKLFFTVAVELDKKASFPIHIILEEAHRYVQNDSDTKILGYNIFDRITKEGRKYGVLLGLITQRPSELSMTAISQCTNFIVFRMYYPEDVNLIKNITSHLSPEKIDKLKTLKPGTAFCFGTAFHLPTITILQLPDPMPISNSVDITNAWYK